MVVEELLQLLVRVIDAELFKRVEVENLESSNVEDADEEVTGEIGGQCSVDNVNEPFENTLVAGFCDCAKGIVDLLDGLSLGNILRADLDLWLAPGF